MIIKIKVIANSSHNKVVGFENDTLKIKCTASPEKGKANQAIIAILSNHYQVPQNTIKILKGATSSQKIIEIEE